MIRSLQSTHRSVAVVGLPALATTCVEAEQRCRRSAAMRPVEARENTSSRAFCFCGGTWRGGGVANATVCKTVKRGFESLPRLSYL